MKGGSRDLAGLPQTLSKLLPYAVRMHGALIRSVVRYVIQWVRDGFPRHFRNTDRAVTNAMTAERDR